MGGRTWSIPAATLGTCLIRAVVWTLLSLTAVAQTPKLPANVPPNAVLHQRLQSLVKQGFGGVVLIQKDDKTLLDEGFGVVHGHRMGAGELFWIASISKTFTAAAVMRCRQRGQVRLEDPIANYFANVPPDKRSVTVLQLLTHASGLPQSYISENIRERDEAVRAILQLPLASPPGAKFGYSNVNYVLLAAIVELKTGKPFEQVVREELLAPLGLVHTGFWFDKDSRSVAPTKEPLPTRLRTRTWELGGGGMYSTTHDLLRWEAGLRSGQVLDRDATALVFSDQIKIQEGYAGFAWFHGRTPKGSEFWFTRGNDSFGPNALIYVYPETHVTVVITSHSGDAPSEVGWSRVALREVEAALGL